MRQMKQSRILQLVKDTIDRKDESFRYCECHGNSQGGRTVKFLPEELKGHQMKWAGIEQCRHLLLSYSA